MIEYKIVCKIEFPDGNEEYVIWEPVFYGEMVSNNVDIASLFYDTTKNGFTTPPLNVWIDLYVSPTIQQIVQGQGDKQGIKQFLVGRKCFGIAVL